MSTTSAKSAPTLRIISRFPDHWPARGSVAQANIAVNRGRLRAKLIVFKSPQAMAAFWRSRLMAGNGGALGAKCLGAVNALTRSRENVVSGTRHIDVDARFFCVIGLVEGHLTMRIITHECVHAAYAFAKRRSRSWWDAAARDFDEEAIADPTGELARNVVAFLNRRKLVT